MKRLKTTESGNLKTKKVFFGCFGIKKSIKYLIFSFFGLFSFFSIFGISFVSAEANNFSNVLEQTTDSIKQQVQGEKVSSVGAASINEFVVENLLIKIAIPLMIFVGILFSVIGFYMMMMSDSADEISKGTNYLIWGAIGTVIMISAKFIANIFWYNILKQGVNSTFDAIKAASDLYNIIIYPFLKLGIYIGIGVLFIMLLISVFKYFTKGEDENQKNAISIIIANVIGILIIMSAKQSVEAVYGQQDKVLGKNITNLGDMGLGTFAEKHIPIIYHIIERVMSLSSFFVLVLILILAFKLLTKPDDEETLTTIKKYIGFALLGILVVGAGYLIVNFLIVT